MAKEITEPRFKVGQTVWVAIVFADKPGEIFYEQHRIKIHEDKVFVGLIGSGNGLFGPFDTVTGELVGRCIPGISSIKLLLNKPEGSKPSE